MLETHTGPEPVIDPTGIVEDVAFYNMYFRGRTWRSLLARLYRWPPLAYQTAVDSSGFSVNAFLNSSVNLIQSASRGRMIPPDLWR